MTNENGQEPIEIPQNVLGSDAGVASPDGLREPPPPGAAGEPGAVPTWVSDPAAAYAEIQKLRDEAGRYRTRANELEAQLETTTAESEQRSQALDTLQAAMRQGEIRAAVLLEAARAGIADPADALALADLSGVTLDEAGQPTGAREAVEALVAAKPYLLDLTLRPPLPVGEGLGVRAPAIAPTNPGNGPSLRPDDLRTLSSEAIARMDPDELRAALSNR